MGITLFSLLHENKEELNEMRKIDLLLQIASGMCYLHGKYIVHLDLVLSLTDCSASYKSRLF
jgi:serine/threonine protein kinase